MKRFITPAATFSPTAGTLDLSAIAGFDIRRLAAVFDLKTQAMIYGPVAGFGATAVTNGVLSLQASVPGLGASDSLLVIYDDATGKVAEDASVQSVVSALQTLIGDVANNHGDLQGLHTDLASTLHADLQAIVTKLGTSPAQSADVAAVVTRLGTSPAQSSDVAAVAAKLGTAPAQSTDVAAVVTKLGTPAQTGDVAAVVTRLGAAPAQTADVAALGVILQSILTVAQAQRSETLCTDASGAYYVRVEKAGVLTFTDLLGNAATPGAGLAPAAGTDLITTADPYRALNPGTGYVAGDIIRHIVTQNPTSGAIVGQFWLNATQSAKIAAPPGTDLQLIDPQAEGASTLAAQLAGNAILAALQTALATLHTDAQTNHADLVALHTDEGTTVHADLQALAAVLGTAGDPATAVTLNGLTKKLVALLSAALTVNIGTTGGVALDASLQTLITVFGSKGDGIGLTSAMGLLAAIKTALAGTLVTKSAAPTPVASAGYGTALLAKAGACTLVNAQATNASNVAGYLIVIDAAAVPAVGAAITPLKQRRLGQSPDGVVDAEAEINTPLAIAAGLVVLLTTTLSTYQPAAASGQGTLSGQLNASFI